MLLLLFAENYRRFARFVVAYAARLMQLGTMLQLLEFFLGEIRRTVTVIGFGRFEFNANLIALIGLSLRIDCLQQVGVFELPVFEQHAAGRFCMHLAVHSLEPFLLVCC